MAVVMDSTVAESFLTSSNGCNTAQEPWPVPDFSTQNHGLHILPPELLNEVVKYLDIVDRSVLALVDKQFRDIFSGFWSDIPLCPIVRKDFLMRLYEDMPEFRFCHECSKFHRRESNELKEWLQPTEQCKWWAVRAAKSFAITWPAAQLTMRAHRSGPAYGVQLTDFEKSLQFELSKKRQLENIMCPPVQVKALVVEGRLLVRFHAIIDRHHKLHDLRIFHSGHVRNFYKSDEREALWWNNIVPQCIHNPSWLPEVPALGFNSMHHRLPFGLESAIELHLRKPLISERISMRGRCPKCPSERLIDYDCGADKKVRIIQWIDLGECGSQPSAEFTAFSTHQEDFVAPEKGREVCRRFERAAGKDMVVEAEQDLDEHVSRSIVDLFWKVPRGGNERPRRYSKHHKPKNTTTGVKDYARREESGSTRLKNDSM